MTNITIKPYSNRDGAKWIPEGMVYFADGLSLTEQSESCKNITFDTEEEANQYFIQARKRKYRLKD